MKFHKLISRTIVATALLGATFGGVLSSGVSANAGDMNQSSSQSSNGNSSNGNSSNTTPSSSVNNDSNAPNYADKGADAKNYTNGSTKITNGSLSLDSVPTLNFKENDSSNNNKLQLQDSGELKVTDYRNKDIGNTDNGWKLQVTSNGFSQKNSHDNNDWKLNLDKTNLDYLTGNDGKNITSNTQIIPQHLSTNDGNQNNGYLVNDGQYGITQLTYNPGNDDATLNVPNVQPDLNNPYTTQMTWNLSTGVSGNKDD